MQTSKRSFQDVLSGSDKQLYCPPLQRPYEWGEQQWSDLYDDLKTAVTSGTKHFFGTLIITEAISEEEVSRHMLIDGQQRLTTLALMLSRGELELGSREDVSAEHQYVIGTIWRVLKNTTLDPNLAWRVWPTLVDQSDFRIAMSRGMPPKGSRIGKASQWFDDKFQNRDEFPDAAALAHFLKKVLSCGVAISIEMDATDDVCAVFSSINGKGKPLAQTDLLKNILMMRSGLPIVEAYDQYWKPFEQGLTRTDIANILRKMVLAEKGWCNAAATLDTLLALPFAQKGRLAELHEKLMGWKAQHQYVAAGMPSRGYTRQTVQLIKRINRVIPLMQAQSLCLVEGLFLLHSKDKLDEEHLRGSLEIVENYVLRTCLVDNQTTRDAYKVMPHVLQASQGAVPDLLAKALLRDNKTYRDTSDERLEGAILRLRMDTKLRRAWVKAALLRIDSFHNAEVEYSDPSLEHVMPQTLEGARQWSADVPAETPHLLGNLTILHRSYNSDLGRASYAEKQAEFARSVVWLNRYFADVPSWGEEEVHARSRALLTEFVKVVPHR